MQRNRTAVFGIAMTLLLGVPSLSHAGLIDRGSGLIYDDVLNITWLQDANYSQTSGYDADGRMTWNAAVTWADQLTYGGYSDWRLPTIVDTGAPGCDFANSATDCGYNVQTTSGATVYSEMASLYYDTLGNEGFCSTSGVCPPASWGLDNTGLFQNFQSDSYWSATADASQTLAAWNFDFHFGFQGAISKSSEFFAWAVRPGDVAAAVPEPGALGLLGAGLALLGWTRNKRRRFAVR